MWTKCLYVLPLLAFLFLDSCRKSDRDKDTTYFSSKDYAFCEAVFSDVFVQVHGLLAHDSTLSTYGKGNIFLNPIACLDTLTQLSSAGGYPKTITLDFGTGNLPACYGGLEKKGKMKITLTKKYSTPFSRVTVEFIGYYLNNNKIEGKLLISNMGTTSDGNTLFSTLLSDGKLYSDSATMNFAWRRDNKWISGSTTNNVDDDVFEIIGSGEGRSSRGNVYTFSDAQPLQLGIDCTYPLKGITVVQPEKLSPRKVDFGDGSCDSDYTIDVNGTVNVLDLKL